MCWLLGCIGNITLNNQIQQSYIAPPQTKQRQSERPVSNLCQRTQCICWFLYSNAVLNAAWQKEEIRRIHSLALPQDVLFNLRQFFFELVNQLTCPGLSEVFLIIVAQWNLDSWGFQRKNMFLIEKKKIHTYMACTISTL